MGNSALAIRAVPEAERSVAFGSITNAYVALGTPLAHSAVIVIFDNQTDEQVQVSWDGTNTWKTFAAGQALVLDVQSNKGLGGAFQISQRTQFYVRYVSAPSSGAFYISVLYGFNANNL